MHTYLSRLFFLLFASTLLLTGCRDTCDSEANLTVDQSQLAADIVKIDAYLERKGIDAEIHPSGIRYVIKRNGEGDRPKICDNVTVTYEGKLISNEISFDSSTSLTSLDLSNTITGWQIGLPLIKDGNGGNTGRITLYIPSVYAYGAIGQSAAGIPANANLEFEVILFQVR